MLSLRLPASTPDFAEVCVFQPDSKMKKLLFLCLALPLLAACSTDANSTKASTDEVVKLCCGGVCGTPEGYCCNENHCGGKCDESLPVWTEELKAAADAEAAK